MSIFLMCDANDNGAKLDQRWSSEDRKIYVKEAYAGKVVRKEEENLAHDSDFYAWVWNEEKQEFLKIQYATTRFWTYPAGAKIDAPDELIARFWDWKEQQEKEKEEAFKLSMIESFEEDFPQLSQEELERLYILYEKLWSRNWRSPDSRKWNAVKTLLRTKNFRSSFRESLRDQLLEWLRGETEYPTPFSPKQWNCLLRLRRYE